jgi:hypothetical protein
MVLRPKYEVSPDVGLTTLWGWFRRSATSQEVAGSIPDEIINVSILLNLPAALAPGVYAACTRNEHQRQNEMFLGNSAQPARKANNFNAICQPIV